MAVSKKRKKAPSFKRDQAMRLAYQVSHAKTEWEAIEAIQNTLDGLPADSGWVDWGQQVLAYLKGDTDTPPLQIIKADGNKKLPFYAWSVLPVFTCPGKGACAGFCYSLKAWRYPQAFFRQVMNTILYRFRKDLVADLFLALPEGVTLRLFVDGDFDSTESVDFWFKLLRLRPDVLSYGYSKSWDELYDYTGIWPDNYVLNLSSGGKVRRVTLEMMQQLLITRGRFVAVPVDAKFIKMGNKRFKSAAYHAAVRESARQLGLGKTMSCPGKCGACINRPSGNEHACGSRRLIGLTIAIGIH